jgi:hypothetical protein
MAKILCSAFIKIDKSYRILAHIDIFLKVSASLMAQNSSHFVICTASFLIISGSSLHVHIMVLFITARPVPVAHLYTVTTAELAA